MKKIAGIVAILFFVGLIGLAAVLLVPNPIGNGLFKTAKARGYLPYSADEAIAMAYDRCGGCHEDEKILKYCARCGPPFIIVANFMKKYVDVANSQGASIAPFTNAELSAIIQVWNGLVGNWESDWRQDDLKHLLRGNKIMIKLLETPVEERPIESALKDKSAPGSYKEVDQTGG